MEIIKGLVLINNERFQQLVTKVIIGRFLGQRIRGHGTGHNNQK